MKPSADLLLWSLWTVVLIIAFVLQAIPILVVVMMFSMAVGFTKEAAMTVMPAVFFALLYLSCLIASKLGPRPPTGSGTRSSIPGAQTRSKFSLPDHVTSPADYYRDQKRLGRW